MLLFLVGACAFLAGQYQASRKYREAQAKMYASILADNLLRAHWYLMLNNDERSERLGRSIKSLSQGLGDVIEDWDAFVDMSHADIMDIHASYRSREEMVDWITTVLARWGYNESEGRTGAEHPCPSENADQHRREVVNESIVQ